MQRLDNKVAIITGGGGGIGGASCHRFAREGAKVAVFDRDLAAAQAVAEDIRASGGVAQAFACDITQRAQVDAAVAQTVTAFGTVDILINNAGWDVFLPFTKTQPEQWDRLIAINLVGALHMHHAVLPIMIEHKAGRIINVSSDAARVGSSGEAVYAACKGGRPTRLCLPTTSRALETLKSWKKLSAVRFRWDALAARTTCLAPWCISPAMTRPT
jgi:2-hydroxycyclohexanecarboxyl-CoA dehydrogenase